MMEKPISKEIQFSESSLACSFSFGNSTTMDFWEREENKLKIKESEGWKVRPDVLNRGAKSLTDFGRKAALPHLSHWALKETQLT